MEKYTFNIYKDNEVLKTLIDQDTDFEAFKFLLKNQSQSVNYALKWGGYKVEQINQETKESTFWKSYV